MKTTQEVHLSFPRQRTDMGHNSRWVRTERLVGKTTMQTHSAVKMKNSVPA